MMQALRKGIVATFVALFCAVLASLTYLDAYYYDNRPRVPDPAHGRIYPEVVKVLSRGVVAKVYLTRTEKLPFEYSMYLSLFFFAGAILLEHRWKTFRNPYEDIPKKFY